MHEGGLGARRRQHAEGEVDADRRQALGGQLPTEVTGATGQVHDRRTDGQAERAHGATPPTNVHPEGHDAIDEVVARRDGIEHRAYRRHLRLALREGVGRGEAGHRGHGRKPRWLYPNR